MPEISREDLGTLGYMAARYAITRLSWAHLVGAELIQKYAASMDRNNLSIIRREIEDALLAMKNPNDVAAWRSALVAVEAELAAHWTTGGAGE